MLTGDKSNAVTSAPLFASSTAIFPEPQPNSSRCLPSRFPKNSEIPGSSLFSLAYRWKFSPCSRISRSPDLFRANSSHFDFSLLYLSSSDMDYSSIDPDFNVPIIGLQPAQTDRFQRKTCPILQRLVHRG